MTTYKGFHLAACRRGWDLNAPASDGCHPDCPRRLWAENERLREAWHDLRDRLLRARYELADPGIHGESRTTCLAKSHGVNLALDYMRAYDLSGSLGEGTEGCASGICKRPAGHDGPHREHVFGRKAQ